MSDDIAHEEVTVANGRVLVSVVHRGDGGETVKLDAAPGLRLEGVAPGEYDVVPIEITRAQVIEQLAAGASGADIVQWLTLTLEIGDDDTASPERDDLTTEELRAAAERMSARTARLRTDAAAERLHAFRERHVEIREDAVDLDRAEWPMPLLQRAVALSRELDVVAARAPEWAHDLEPLRQWFCENDVPTTWRPGVGA